VVATSRFGCRLPRPRGIRRVAPGPLTAPSAGGARAGKHLAGAGGRTARRKRRLAPRQERGVATALLPATRAPGPRPGRRRPARPAGRRDHPRPVRRTRWTPVATSLSPESRICGTVQMASACITSVAASPGLQGAWPESAHGPTFARLAALAIIGAA
jgi:hypothetical protein